MLIDAALVTGALRLPDGTSVEAEPLDAGRERWRVCPAGGPERVVIARRDPDVERAANNAAVTDALLRAHFEGLPPILSVTEDTVLEEEVRAVTALAVIPPEGSCEAAMEALAALHAEPVREGTRWGLRPEDVLPDEDLPLYRLGFAAHEREAAAAALEEARRAILAAPWGFVHGAATAANVLLAPRRAWLTGFEDAGFGCQFYDVAAFLLTGGLDESRRRELARHYARERSLEPEATADLIDLASIMWGIGELLTLPRKTIQLLGDDPGMAALNMAATRIERGIREPAGRLPAAVAIRAALWPS